jgi:hypothetical protein
VTQNVADDAREETLEPEGITIWSFIDTFLLMTALEARQSYQVTNSGAEMLASSFDRSILLRYTIEIDTTQYALITPKT